MTRPFLTEEECRSPASHPKLVEANAALNQRQRQQQPMMFTRAKFSRFEVLPPVMCTRRLYIQVAFLLLIGLVIFLLRMMGAMRGTFVHYHLESDTDGELVILPEEFVETRGAVCLDGTPPAYYYRQSVVPAVNFWIIHLQSGGWCTTADDCLERSETRYGSSLHNEMSLPLEGILSSNCDTNPDFCLWHVIDLVYCDGGSYLGNRTDPLVVNSKNLYLRGALVFDALIEYLTTFTLFKNAEQIILAGSSAGSLGSLIHANRLRERLPSSVKTLHLVVDGGLFVDVADINGDHTMALMLKDVFALHHVHKLGGLQKCRQHKAQQDEWSCVLPQVFHPYVFTPIFFINSLYDTWYRNNALKIHCNADLCPQLNMQQVLVARTQLLKKGPMSIVTLLTQVLVARAQMLKEGREILQSSLNAVFLTSCPTHTALVKASFSSLRARGLTVQQGLGAWINHLEHHRNLTEVLDLPDALTACQLPS